MNPPRGVSKMLKFDNDKGAISINNDVFLKIVDDAVTGCFGVKAMGGKGVDGNIFRMLKEAMSKEIEAYFEDGDKLCLKIHIVAVYGVNLIALGRSIINEVKYKVSKSTGLEVKNIELYFDNMLID